MPELSLNFLLQTKPGRYVGEPTTRVYEFSRPVMVKPFAPRQELQTGKVQSGQVLTTMRLLEELGHRMPSGGIRTGEGDFTAGMKEAMDSMGIDTEGIYDSGKLKEKIATHKIKRAQNLLGDAARLRGGSVQGIPTEHLQAAIMEKETEKAAAALFDKERFSVWRPLSLVKNQSFAAGASVSISQTPPRNMWATFLIVNGSPEFFTFSSLQIMGETMFSGDTELATGSFAPGAFYNQELSQELQSGVPVTGALHNVDGAAAHFGGCAIQGWIEKLNSARK